MLTQLVLNSWAQVIGLSWMAAFGRGWQTFSRKGQIVKSLGFVGPAVSSQLLDSAAHAAAMGSTYMNGWGGFLFLL